MTPKSPQLVRTAMSAILQAQRSPETAHIPDTLESVRVILNELLLREQADFFVSYHAEGRALLDEGSALLGSSAHTALSVPDNADLNAATVAVTEALSELVLALDERGDAPARQLAERIVAWELGYYAHGMEEAVNRAADDDNPRHNLTAERLQTYLRAHRPEWPNITVKNLKLQPGGFSKITALVDVHDDKNGDHGIVVRAAPPRRMLDLDGHIISLEYPVLRYAFGQEMPMAEPYFFEADLKHIGMQFIVSERMPGRIMGGIQGSSETSEEALKDVIALMARIANLPVDRKDPLLQASHLKRWLAHETLADNTRDFIVYWRDIGISGNAPTSPLVTRGVHWLLNNVPQEDARQNLIHGDIGFHNILFEGDKLSALLDWENTRYGDSAEELTNFMLATSSQASREQILAWYLEAGGPDISEYRLRYYDVYHCIKMVIAAQVSSQRVEEDPEGSIHLAVYGLQYLYYVGKKLNELISLAEQAKVTTQ